MVIWITGLSGTGKSTLARKLAETLNLNGPRTFIVDGDDIRKLFEVDKGEHNYSIEGRRANANRLVRMSKYVEKQGFRVICATLCIFEDILKQNLSTFDEYIQIHLSANMQTLADRDIKGIYKIRSIAEKKEFGPVVGVDIDYIAPEGSHLEFDTDVCSPEFIANRILSYISKRI